MLLPARKELFNGGMTNAMAALSRKAALTPFTYEPGPLNANEVEIAVTHCGICHSDVHLVDDDWGLSRYPLVPGHEVVGTVAAVGADVKGFPAGQRVGLGWQCGSCGVCALCKAGNEHLCGKSEATAVWHHGGFASRVRSDARFVIPIPEALASETAAPLLCGGVTVFSPLHRLGAGPGTRVGVVGIGGLGHLALQFARALGCEVTAFSSNPDKEAEARSFGATRFLESTTKGLEAARNSLDLLISTLHTPIDGPAALSALAARGTFCVVGASGKPIDLPAFSLIGGEKSVTGSAIGSPSTIRAMLEVAAGKGVAALTEPMPLARAEEGLQRVRNGKARYRVVLAM